MVKLTPKDHASLATFMIMIGIVLFSFITSDFFPDNLSITGAVVATATTKSNYSISYVPTSSAKPYTNENIIFYISIENKTSGDSLGEASCKIGIDENANINMVYVSSRTRYENTRKITTSGSHTYNIACDMSIYGDADINETNSITVFDAKPDFNVSVDAPGTAAAKSSTSITVKIENIGPKSYSGTLGYDIDYGDGYKSASQSISFSGSSEEVTLTHEYTTVGNYTVKVDVDPNEGISELNESNNRGTDNITVYNSSAQPMVCGTITSSVKMTKDFYCNGNIILNQAGITLDCNNYTIYGDGKTINKKGIIVKKDATIKNCEIKDYKTAVIANAKLTLYNSSIKNSGTGLILNSTGNNITRNIFKSNEIGINNTKESIVNGNDFLSNTLHLSTTWNLNFKKNYFGTVQYQEVISKIENSSVAVTVIPFMNSSVRNPNSGEVTTDVEGPNINVSIGTGISNYKTKVSIEVNTSEDAICRFSDTNKSFASMTKLTSSNNKTHLGTKSYSEEKTIYVYVTCKDLQGNPTEYKSSQISIISGIDVALVELKKEIESYKDEKSDHTKDKTEYEKDLKEEEDASERAEIQEDIDKKGVEITYYEALIDSAEDLQSDLKKTNNQTKKIEKDYINEYNKEISNLTEDLNETEEDIKTALIVESDDIYTLLKSKFDSVKKLYDYYDKNETKTSEKEDLENDHIILILEKQKEDLVADKARYTALDAIGDGINTDYITETEDDILNMEEEIVKAQDDEAIDDYELEITLLTKQIATGKSYKKELNALLLHIDDGIEFSTENSNYRTAQSLTNLKEQTDDKIDDIESDIEDYESDLETAEDALANYEKSTGSVSTTSKVIRITIRSNTTSNTIMQTINNSNMYMTKATITFSKGNSTSGYVYITKLDSIPYSDNLDAATFEWYVINASAGITINKTTLQFIINESYLASLNTTTENVKVYVYDNKNFWWDTQETTSVKKGSSVEVNVVDISAGTIAIGYQKLSTPIEPSCTANWVCSNFSACDEKDNKIRNCTDQNNCSSDVNNTKVEERSCSVEETCYDEIKNQDEKGIDCGGSCPDACVKIENQTITVEEEKASNTRSRIMSIVMIALIVISTAGLGAELILKHKSKKKKVVIEDPEETLKKYKEKMEGSSMKPKIAKKEATPDTPVQKESNFEKKRLPYFNYEILNKIIQKLCKYENMDNIKQELQMHGSGRQQIEYALHLANYVFGKLENNAVVKDITAELVKQKWKPEEARHIVNYIAVRYLFHELEEYFTISESSEEENKIMRDMFKSEGYEDELINEAFSLYEKNNNNIQSA